MVTPECLAAPCKRMITDARHNLLHQPQCLLCCWRSNAYPSVAMFLPLGCPSRTSCQRCRLAFSRQVPGEPANHCLLAFDCSRNHLNTCRIEYTGLPSRSTTVASASSDSMAVDSAHVTGCHARYRHRMCAHDVSTGCTALQHAPRRCRASAQRPTSVQSCRCSGIISVQTITQRQHHVSAPCSVSVRPSAAGPAASARVARGRGVHWQVCLCLRPLSWPTVLLVPLCT